MEYNRDAAEIYVVPGFWKGEDTPSAQPFALRAKLGVGKTGVHLLVFTVNRRRPRVWWPPPRGAQSRVRLRLHRMGAPLSNNQLNTFCERPRRLLSGDGPCGLALDHNRLQKTIPENEVGNEARILLDDEVGPGGASRYPIDCAPARRSTARRSHSPFNF